MNYNKDEYERLIDESNLFSINKDTQKSLYKREALKMVEYLYCYLLAVKQQQYEPYGMEIVETAKRCIENYKPESGRFLNYFTSAWKQEYGHIVGKEIIKETFGGIHFTEDEERNYRKYMKLAQSMGIDTSSTEFEQRVSEAMGISLKEMVVLKNMVNSKVMPITAISDDGEEFSLLDCIDNGEYADSELVQIEKAKELLDLIEIVFNQLQERQKPILSKLITSKVALLFSDEEDVICIIKEKSYFDDDIYNDSIKRGEPIQSKEIADLFNVSEASISRTWKTFKEKLYMKKNQ